MCCMVFVQVSYTDFDVNRSFGMGELNKPNWKMNRDN